MTTISMKSEVAPINLDEMLQRWQGHRSLTRRVIDSFPENELFTFSIGGMRPFAAMVHEFLQNDRAGPPGYYQRSMGKGR
ncbi:MAG: hypothetical protein NVV59_19165 [Chitinophagaceae bacterium]|nr:hypothetical protein [Chitinophagaceae bacterium]